MWSKKNLPFSFSSWFTSKRYDNEIVIGRRFTPKLFSRAFQAVFFSCFSKKNGSTCFNIDLFTRTWWPFFFQTLEEFGNQKIMHLDNKESALLCGKRDFSFKKGPQRQHLFLRGKKLKKRSRKKTPIPSLITLHFLSCLPAKVKERWHTQKWSSLLKVDAAAMWQSRSRSAEREGTQMSTGSLVVSVEGKKKKEQSLSRR